jgi:hypothetical protein
MILALLAFAGCPASQAASPRFTTIALYTLSAGGRDFTIIATRRQIEASPSWKQHEKEPPLSVREAVRIATDWFQIKGYPDARIDFIELDRIEGFENKWYYRLIFGGSREYAETPYRCVILLMNGEILEAQPGRLLSK